MPRPTAAEIERALTAAADRLALQAARDRAALSKTTQALRGWAAPLHAGLVEAARRAAGR